MNSAPREVKGFPQYQNLYGRLQNESPQAAVYGVDYCYKDDRSTYNAVSNELILRGTIMISTSVVGVPKIINGDMMVGIGLLAAGVVAAYPIVPIKLEAHTKESHSFLTQLTAWGTSLLPTPIIGFRDAVAAKKISQYLVPKHKQEGRKVQAAILYGAAHSGIEAKIKYPWTADATLWLYHTLFHYGDTVELNQVREIVPGKDDFVTEDCGLF